MQWHILSLYLPFLKVLLLLVASFLFSGVRRREKADLLPLFLIGLTLNLSDDIYTKSILSYGAFLIPSVDFSYDSFNKYLSTVPGEK